LGDCGRVENVCQETSFNISGRFGEKFGVKFGENNLERRTDLEIRGVSRISNPVGICAVIAMKME